MATNETIESAGDFEDDEDTIETEGPDIVSQFDSVNSAAEVATTSNS